MDWWNDIWLNEGFATWIGRVAVDHLYPEWEIWSLFSGEGLQLALELDSLLSSHPIEIEILDALDVAQVFDVISYVKGASVLRMLSSFIGMENMMKGVSNYLRAYSYQNATTADLWSEISAVCGRDVKHLMQDWTGRMGYPIVSVSDSDHTVSFHQSRYVSRSIESAPENELWWIPLTLSEGPEALFVMGDKLVIPELDVPFIKVNADSIGFYRTKYSPAALIAFGNHLQVLSPSDKIGLIADALALAVSGHSRTSFLLAFLQSFRVETNVFVWRQVKDALDTIRSVFGDDPELDANLRLFILHLITDRMHQISWDRQQGGSDQEALRDALLIDLAGVFGERRKVPKKNS